MSGVRFVRYMASLAACHRESHWNGPMRPCSYVGLGEVRYRKVNTYSLGMKQLVSWPKALAHGPKLLSCMSPTNASIPSPPAHDSTHQDIRKEGSVAAA